MHHVRYVMNHLRNLIHLLFLVRDIAHQEIGVALHAARMLIDGLRYHLHAAQNWADRFDHGIGGIHDWRQFRVSGAHAKAKVAASQLLHIFAQERDALFEGDALGFALLEETRVIDGNRGLIGKQLGDLDALLRRYLAIRWIVKREEAEQLLGAWAVEWNDEHIIRVPATGLRIFYNLAWNICYIRKKI